MKKKNRFRRWPLILAVVALTAGMTACGSEKSTLPDLSFMGCLLYTSEQWTKYDPDISMGSIITWNCNFYICGNFQSVR